MNPRTEMLEDIVEFIRDLYGSEEFIPLHVPHFIGNEKKYVDSCIESTFVSSVGQFVDRFEEQVADYTGAKHAVAAVNGTAALHMALLVAGVERDEEVITQPLTFVATANAIHYTGADPVFVDVDRDTLGMSPDSLETFLKEHAESRNGQTYNRTTGMQIKACIPVHTFGHPCRIDRIKSICEEYGITLIEDAAESIGSLYKEQHTGTFGKLGIFSFNGNKTITAGGGGMIVTDETDLAERAKHLTTTAKQPHKWEYIHDRVGYNYRLTNINAALGAAQMEQLDSFLENKRETARRYETFFESLDIDFITEPDSARSNYWLNSVLTGSREDRDRLLEYTNDNGIMTRPAWRLMTKLKMFENCFHADLENAEWLEDRIVNIPSSYRTNA